MDKFDRRKFLKALGFSAFALGAGIPNVFFKANAEGIDWFQNISYLGNSPLKRADQVNIKGFAYDYHTREIIKNARIIITASQIKVEDNKLVKDTNGSPMKEGLQVTAHLKKDGSYEMPLSRGLFQINIKGRNKYNSRYNSNSYFVVLDNQDILFNIELARKDEVKRIENERDKFYEGYVNT